jgi:hypothetical protein
LTREQELVAKIAQAQDSVRKAVINRKWMEFEMHLNSLGQIGEAFEELDRERMRIFAALSGNGGGPENSGEAAGFYTLVSRLPEAERRAITGLYRSLKMETIKVRMGNDALMTYLAETRLVVAGFLEAAFPDRKGRIYSRRGTQVQADMRSMVLSRRL